MKCQLRRLQVSVHSEKKFFASYKFKLLLQIFCCIRFLSLERWVTLDVYTVGKIWGVTTSGRQPHKSKRKFDGIYYTSTPAVNRLLLQLLHTMWEMFLYSQSQKLICGFNQTKRHRSVNILFFCRKSCFWTQILTSSSIIIRLDLLKVFLHKAIISCSFFLFG